MMNVCTRFCLRRRGFIVGNNKQKDIDVLAYILLLSSENMVTHDHME
jgi:hypothetical protein